MAGVTTLCRCAAHAALRDEHAGRRTVIPGMTYAPVNGLQLYYEIRGSGRPLVLLHGGLMTIDLNFGPLLEPLAASRQVIAVELQGHGHTADTDRAMTIEALAGDVIALLDYLGIAEADLFGSSRGGLIAYAVALGAPTPGRDTAARRSARVDHTVPRRTSRNAVMRLGALPSWRPPRLAGDRRRGKVSRVMCC